MKLVTAVLLLIVHLPQAFCQERGVFIGKGEVSFTSIAPLEVISAKSGELNGIVDLDKSTFAFNFPVRSFSGFNSPLQKEHFNEHYLETDKYPKATFTGKIIELEKVEGDYLQEIYAKGKMTIHGQTKIMTIQVSMDRKNNTLEAKSDFTVSLSDFGISIPTLLEAKISPNINVSVRIKLYNNE